MIGPDLEGVTSYVLKRLGNELPPQLTYHCLEHTRDDVLPAALRLATMHRMSRRDTLLLTTAALFHDLGFIERREGHEGVGARIAREALPEFGFAADQIEIVVGMILATRLPQTPRTLLENLLSDADLDVLGRHDFFARNDALRVELDGDRPRSDVEWYSAQLAFLESHSYFTPAAAKLRDAGKRRNIAEMRRRLCR